MILCIIPSQLVSGEADDGAKSNDFAQLSLSLKQIECWTICA